MFLYYSSSVKRWTHKKIAPQIATVMASDDIAIFSPTQYIINPKKIVAKKADNIIPNIFFILKI